MKIGLDQAIAAQKKAEQDFIALCAKGRETGVTIDEFAANRNAATKAAADMWDAMFHMIADTGVRIKRT